MTFPKKFIPHKPHKDKFIPHKPKPKVGKRKTTTVARERAIVQYEEDLFKDEAEQ
jgi:hypothetical protein